MDHEEARRKAIGGKVLGFFYWANADTVVGKSLMPAILVD
jgi:hypothetical protein